ncbi:hypothetical protein B0W81_05250 [Prochlorococcus sp. HOT_208_60]|nr:hypothetical protein B0W81_05250 [Prochlorococcus sp. HOT_208_60]
MKKKIRVAVTGANGFIGFELCNFLEKNGFIVRRIQRYKGEGLFQIVDINGKTNWTLALDKVDIVVHCASVVHDQNKLNFAHYNELNVEGTCNLFKQSIKLGVKKFIFISTIKVNGEYTNKDEKFSSTSKPNPYGNYSISKYKTENILKEISNLSNIELVIIRPPLVYGPRVKANFYNLMKLTSKGIPLPFKDLKKERSFIFLGNLVDLIANCITNQKSSNKIILPSDSKAIKTRTLINKLYSEFGYSSRLFYFPTKILHLIFYFLGKKEQFSRLNNSLIVDSNEVEKQINWTPPYSFEDGIKKTVNWFKENVV